MFHAQLYVEKSFIETLMRLTDSFLYFKTGSLTSWTINVGRLT